MSNPAENYAGVLMAMAFNEFDKENLNVTIQRVGGSDSLLLLTQGTIHMQASGLSAALLNLINQRDSLRITGYQYDLPADSKEGYWFRNEMYKADGTLD